MLLMGWVDPPKYFCAISETLTDVANALVHNFIPVPAYGVIAAIPETGPVPPYTLYSLTHINCYMDDVLTAVPGGGRPKTRGLRRHDPGPKMAFSVLARRNQGVCQCE